MTAKPEKSSPRRTRKRRRQSSSCGAPRRGPQRIDSVLAELMARNGFARLQGAAAVEEAWRQAAGRWGKYTRVGKLRRGNLEIIVGHSALLQELAFHKERLLESIRQQLPDEEIQQIRFRLGAVE